MGMSDVGVSDILAQFVATLGSYCPELRTRQKVFFTVLHHFIPFIDPTFALMLRFADFYADR